jgi:hypothetical protein
MTPEAREKRNAKRRSGSLAALKKALLGKRAHLPVGDASFTCTITDVRKAFGRVDVLLIPLEGTGAIWVDLHNVTLGEGVKLP